MTAVDIATVEQLLYIEEFAKEAERALSADWMRMDYSRYLYGGWFHEDGRWIDTPHYKAIAFHQAAKARFCPICWSPVGFIGSDPDEMFLCQNCDREFSLRGSPDKRTGIYQLLFVSGGNQSSKSFSGCSEFCAMIEGHRPWDGSITTLDREPGLWLMGAPTHTSHFKDTNCPYFETRLGHRIVGVDKESNGQLRRYHLDTGDEVVLVSYEQVLKAGKRAAAVEGARYKGAWLDEPPPRSMLPGVMRGLMRWQSRGEGRCIITGTSIYDEYLFNTVLQRSWNLGGDQRQFFTIEFSFSDNPSLTEAQKVNLEATTSPDEREMRLHGRFKTIAGRVYKAFDPSVHTFSCFDFDPLVHPDDQEKPASLQRPSNWPVIMAIDPHDVRPPAIVWVAISPLDHYYVVREWPEEPYEDLRRSDLSLDDIASVIRDVEEGIPGGSKRVMMRLIDPRFGPSSKFGLGISSVQQALADAGVYCIHEFDPDIAHRHGALRNLLAWDESRPLDALNCPKWYVKDDLRNCQWSFSNYSKQPDKDLDKSPTSKWSDAGKDFCDAMGFIAVVRPKYTPVSGATSIQEIAKKDAERWRSSQFGGKTW